MARLVNLCMQLSTGRLQTSRWHLRRAIATMNQHLEAFGLTQHPDKTTRDKTTIGPLARGFDFLGYQFDPAGLSLSVVTRARHRKKSDPAL